MPVILSSTPAIWFGVVVSRDRTQQPLAQLKSLLLSQQNQSVFDLRTWVIENSVMPVRALSEYDRQSPAAVCVGKARLADPC